MHGVTTAIVLAIFAGIFWPHAIRNRKQFHMAIGALLAIILLDAIAGAMGTDPSGRPGAFARFAHLAIGLFQIFAILAIILASSGQTVAELTGEVAGTVEVVRRGEEEKEILFKGRRRPDEDDPTEAAERTDIHLTDVGTRIPLRPPARPVGAAGASPAIPPPPPPPAAGREGPIPLE